MEGETPFEKLTELGYDLPQEFAFFPLAVLDSISTDWLLETGSNLLAYCIRKALEASHSPLKGELPLISP